MIDKNKQDKRIRPRKKLGQNWLTDQNILRKIIQAAEIQKTDNVLEVGPGQGVLTIELDKLAGKVLAVEKDRFLLEDLFQMEWQKTEFIEADILKFSEADLKKHFKSKPYKIVANLPYNITSKFFRKFLEQKYQPEEMLIMIQKEVGERIVNQNEMNLLALSVNFFAEPKILFTVKRTCFFPSPNVDSVVIKLSNIKTNKYKVKAESFFSVVKAGFASKRKLLISNLKKVSKNDLKPIFEKLNFDLNIRAEELSIDDWVKLVQNIE